MSTAEEKKRMYHEILTNGRIEFEGVVLVVDPNSEAIVAGDIYFTPGRSTGPKLLTCRKHNRRSGVVFPRENAYAFDTSECFRVISIDGEEF